MLNQDQIQQNTIRFRNHFPATPLIRLEALENHLATPCQIYLKCEHTQPTGSFKLRGAFFAIDSLTPQEKKAGVVARSSGNFAIALSYMGQQMGVKVHIVIPPFAPETKKQLILLYGGILTEFGTSHTEQMQKVQELAQEHHLAIRHPYNHLSMIEGSSTLGFECVEELQGIDLAIAPIGGGGLMAGFARAIKQFSAAEVLGVEPFGARDYYLSRESGRKRAFTPSTIADGLRAPEVGDIPYPYLNESVDQIALVDDRYLQKAMKFLYESAGMMIEPSGVAGVAALVENPQYLQGKKRACIVLTGSNVDKKVFDAALAVDN